MLVEFKEKTFESYFVTELARKNDAYISPDQADEFFLGFDAMFRIPYWRREFWLRDIGSHSWFSGVTPNDIKLMGREFNDRFTNIKANLFFQFKRPELLEGPRSKEWKYWKVPYYRFSLYQHQHDILVDLSSCVSGKAKVLYAAPMISSTQELLNASIRGDILANSKLVEAIDLNGHKKCTYTVSSIPALGHSEPEELAIFEMEAFLSELEESDSNTFTERVKRVGTEMKEALTDNVEAKELLYLARSVATDGLTDDMPVELRDTWFDHLITIDVFSRIFGVRTCFFNYR